jgi:hypothetical protein
MSYFLSVIINYFHIISMSILPQKADAPLVIDADAPLALSVSGQFLEPVCRRYAEKYESSGTMELGQFAKCCPLQIGRKLGRKPTTIDPLRLFTLE